jgi:hypothetical protein
MMTVEERDEMLSYGASAERERIIALLEEEAKTWSEFCTLPIDPEHCQSCYLFNNLISLIEGVTSERV